MQESKKTIWIVCIIRLILAFHTFFRIWWTIRQKNWILQARRWSKRPKDHQATLPCRLLCIPLQLLTRLWSLRHSPCGKACSHRTSQKYLTGNTVESRASGSLATMHTGRMQTQHLARESRAVLCRDNKGGTLNGKGCLEICLAYGKDMASKGGQFKNFKGLAKATSKAGGHCPAATGSKLADCHDCTCSALQAPPWVEMASDLHRNSLTQTEPSSSSNSL